VTKYLHFLKKRRSNVNKKAKGSTLVETLVAMTILLTIISMFFLQISRINASINPTSYYKAFLISNELLSSEKGYGMEGDFLMYGFLIKRRVIVCKQDQTYEVVITVFLQNGHKIVENRKIISNRIEI
jgi:hypothetical protein